MSDGLERIGHSAAMARAADGPGLHIDAVGRRFGSFVALRDIDLQVRRGEFLTLLGPSGSGKTTLLMIVAGFLEPSAGRLRLDGRDITGLAPEKRNFGMVFQGYALFPHMTVRQNVAYPLEVRRQPGPQIAARVAELLELVQLGAFADRLPRQLSGGQQQRVALARALAFGPELLLLDEPLGALDRKLRSDVQAELKALHRRVGTTFLYVTHDQDEALSMSDRVVVMNHGRLVQVAGPRELYDRPASVFAAGFLGKSNFLRGRVAGRERGLLVCDVAGHRVLQAAPAAAPADGAPVTLALRPEKIALAGDGPGETGAGAVNRIAGRIADVTYLGAVIEIALDTAAAGRLLVQVPAWRSSAALQPGRDLAVRWDSDAAVAVAEDGS